MNDTKAAVPISLNVHSGGMIAVMCAYRDGRCGRGRVSTRKATFVGSKIEVEAWAVGASFEFVGWSRRGEQVWGVGPELDNGQQYFSSFGKEF